MMVEQENANSAWDTNISRDLYAATFTPMADDHSLNLCAVAPMVEGLIENGIEGLYVCGITGEGGSTSSGERRKVVEAFIQASNGRIPVIVNVSADDPAESRRLAAHAASVGAAAISAVPHDAGDDVVRAEVRIATVLAKVAEGAPDLPFMLYHIATNAVEGVDFVDLVNACSDAIPTMAAVKFSDTRVHVLQVALALTSPSLKYYFGVDEMLASGLLAGAHGGIGSTYCFAAPLYRRVVDAVVSGDLEVARLAQSQSAQMVRTVLSHGGLSAQKAVMSLTGVACGPCRPPHPQISGATIEALHTELEEIGFFEWAS